MSISNKHVNLTPQARPYAKEIVNQSIWAVLSTYSLLIVSICLFLLVQPVIFKDIISILIGLFATSCFIFTPVASSLSPQDIIAFFKLKLRGEQNQRMIGFNELPERNNIYRSSPLEIY